MKWVVNSIPVGNGSYAMKYLAQYVFRVAIGNNRILKHQDGFVTFKYKRLKDKDLESYKTEYRRIYQTFSAARLAAPSFVKVRYFGLFASKNRSLLNIANKLLRHPMTKKENKKSS